MQYGGRRYGLTRDAIEEVAREGLACCVHMELEVRMEAALEKTSSRVLP